jgi:hypothetical protein
MTNSRSKNNSNESSQTIQKNINNNNVTSLKKSFEKTIYSTLPNELVQLIFNNVKETPLNEKSKFLWRNVNEPSKENMRRAKYQSTIQVDNVKLIVSVSLPTNIDGDFISLGGKLEDLKTSKQYEFSIKLRHMTNSIKQDADYNSVYNTANSRRVSLNSNVIPNSNTNKNPSFLVEFEAINDTFNAMSTMNINDKYVKIMYFLAFDGIKKLVTKDNTQPENHFLKKVLCHLKCKQYKQWVGFKVSHGKNYQKEITIIKNVLDIIQNDYKRLNVSKQSIRFY